MVMLEGRLKNLKLIDYANPGKCLAGNGEIVLGRSAWISFSQVSRHGRNYREVTEVYIGMSKLRNKLLGTIRPFVTCGYLPLLFLD